MRVFVNSRMGESLQRREWQGADQLRRACLDVSFFFFGAFAAASASGSKDSSASSSEGKSAFKKDAMAMPLG